MSLGLYKETKPDDIYEDNKPFRVTFDGRLGGYIDQQIFIRNDDPTRYYSDIQILAVDTEGSEDLTNYSVPGFYWKFAESNHPLTPDEWEKVEPGNTLTLSQDIGSEEEGDIVTYHSVWVQVGIPRNQDVQTIKDIVIRIAATETLVDG